MEKELKVKYYPRPKIDPSMIETDTKVVIFLTEQSLLELLQGKIIYDEHGERLIYPPNTNLLGIMRFEENTGQRG